MISRLDEPAEGSVLLPRFEDLEVLVGEEAAAKTLRLCELLLAAPFRAVGPREAGRVIDEILIDSFAPVFLGATPEKAVRGLDLGCGPGIPALPLALIRPAWRILGLDSTAKKIAAARGFAGHLSLDNVIFAAERVHEIEGSGRPTRENLIHRGWLGCCDYVFLRGVGAVQEALELSRRFLKPGGSAILYSTADSFEQNSREHSGLAERWEFSLYPYRRPLSQRRYLIVKADPTS